MRFPSISSLWVATRAVVRRFPLPFLAALMGVCAILFLIEMERYTHDDPLVKIAGRLAMTAALGLPLLIGLTVWAESRNWTDDSWRKWTLLGGALLALTGYFLLLDPEGYGFEYRGLPRYIGLLGVAHLLVAFGPYLNQRSVADFWEYNRQLFANLVTGAFYTMVLWVGLSGAVLAVDQLFDVDVNYRIYPKLFVLLAGLFNTIYFLFHLPKRFEFDRDESNVWAFQILVKYILIPITVLYFVILYAYSAKIGLTWSLPKGWVASLVIGFAAVGIFTWLLNFALARAEAGAPHGFFARWMWPVLLPMVGLLFVGVGRRISDYGITESRFTVAHLGVWLLVCGVYFVWSKRDNIKFVPISLAAFVLVSLYGPLSMFAVSARSQKAELQRLLEKNGRWANGQAQPGTGTVDAKEAARIEDVLLYFTRRDDFAVERPTWLAGVPDTLLKTASWTTPSKITSWLKIDVAPDPTNPEIAYGGVSGPSNEGSWTVPADFRTVFQVEIYRSGGPEVRNKQRSLRIATDGSALLLYAPSGGSEAVVQDSFPVTETLKAWYDRNPSLQLDSVEAVSLRGQSRQAWVLFRHANYQRKGGAFTLESLDATVFLKEK